MPREASARSSTTCRICLLRDGRAIRSRSYHEGEWSDWITSYPRRCEYTASGNVGKIEVYDYSNDGSTPSTTLTLTFVEAQAEAFVLLYHESTIRFWGTFALRDAALMNQEPYASHQIEAPVLHVDANPRWVQYRLNQYFTDPDGDTLFYEASSSDKGVAYTTLAGDVLRVRAVAIGKATITVRTEEPAGALASQEFEISVE